MLRLCIECGSQFEGEQWRKYCRSCFRLKKEREEKQAVIQAYNDGFMDGQMFSKPFDSRTVFELIQLCHPDRHPTERKDLATKITAMLNDMR